MKYTKFIILFAFIMTGCGINEIVYDENVLDATGVYDTSLVDLSFRVSSHPDLPNLDRSTPVIICAHGYGACTYEWEEFRDYAMADGRVYTSLVLLGGHGRDIEDFRKSTWEQWQAPIMAEFDSLVKLGFKHLSFAGSSTGGSLFLEYLSRKAFDNKAVIPECFFLIDPIIVPSSKTLTMVKLIGPIIGNVYIGPQTDIEKRHWYQNRPAETLEQLNEVVSLVRSRLEKGIMLPSGAEAKVYKSTTDDAADPVGALLIYKGLTGSDGSKVEVEMIDSDLHVFTRLRGRAVTTALDSSRQQRVFAEMVEKVLR